MSAQTVIESIAPGTVVIGVDGVRIGTVETADRTGMRVAGHAVPAAAIARVEEDRVLLHVAKAAFQARRDPDLAGKGAHRD